MKRIIIRPLITEKNTGLQEMRNQYAFEVGIDANKIEIAGALTLYLDFINLFLYLLRLFGRRR